MDTQSQYRYKGIQMTKLLKVRLDRTQKFNATRLVMTINILIIIQETDHKIPALVFFFKRTQEFACQNSQILAVSNGNLGAEIEAQNRIPLDYGSEFQNINGIKNLFCHHEDN